MFNRLLQVLILFVHGIKYIYISNHRHLCILFKWDFRDASTLYFEEHRLHWYIVILLECLFLTCFWRPSLFWNFFVHFKQEFSSRFSFNFIWRRRQYLDLNVIEQVLHFKSLLIWWFFLQCRSKLFFFVNTIWQSLHSNVADFCCVSWFDDMCLKKSMFCANFKRQYGHEYIYFLSSNSSDFLVRVLVILILGPVRCFLFILQKKSVVNQYALTDK